MSEGKVQDTFRKIMDLLHWKCSGWKFSVRLTPRIAIFVMIGKYWATSGGGNEFCQMMILVCGKHNIVSLESFQVILQILMVYKKRRCNDDQKIL